MRKLVIKQAISQSKVDRVYQQLNKAIEKNGTLFTINKLLKIIM